MNTPVQKTIKQYLEENQVGQDKKEAVLMAVTDTIYQRNQNVVKAEKEQDQNRKKQFLNSVAEYDQMINRKIQAVSNGKQDEGEYEF